MKWPDDFQGLVEGCGYSPGDDDQRRIDALIGIARTVKYWRNKCDEAIRGTAREKMYQHLTRRLLAITRKLRNVRAAAIAYKAGRDFDALVKSLEPFNEKRKG